MPDRLGQSLDRYQILELLGKGGMAEVYRAHDPRLQRDVAIKVIRPGQEHSERFLERFNREARAHARLSHGHIVKIMDFGEEGGAPYLVMEFIAGGTLAQKTGSPLPFQEAARHLAPIARALEYAHHEKIVHRDVKPSNILLTARGAPMLSDFGIAKIMEDEETRELTAAGAGIGTAAYMAPEQGTNVNVDYRADIYALGVVFYELVTGHKPFEGDSDLAIMVKKATEAVPRPVKYVPGLPGYVEEVMLKALARNPAQRYQETGHFADALEKLGSSERPAISGVAERQAGFPLMGRLKRPATWVALGLLIVCLGGAAAVAASRSLLPGLFRPAVTPSPSPPPATETQDQPTLEAAVFEPTSAPTSTFVATDPETPVGKIVFTCQVFRDLEHDQICLMNADGSGWKRLTHNDSGDYNYPAFSPDGRSILYAGNEGRGFGIYEMALDSNLLTTIPCPTDWPCYEPDVSPDNHRLVVTSENDAGAHSVWVMDRFGGNPDRIADDGWSPVWSPDGSQVLYAAGVQRPQLFIVNSDGSGKRPVTDMDGLRGRGRSDWSITDLIVTAAGPDGQREIYTLTPDGSTPKRVGTTGGNSQGPAFSPDGRWIVFTTYFDGLRGGHGCEIYVMWTDGSHLRRLTENDYCDWQPRWGP